MALRAGCSFTLLGRERHSSRVIPCLRSGQPRGFRGPGAKLQNEAPCVCDRSEQKGKKARESGEMNLEALLEPCRPLLLGGSFDTCK